MSGRTLKVLAIATLLAIVVAWTVTRERAAQTEITRALVYPGLADRVNDIARIEIDAAGERAVLVRNDTGWVVENRGGYPATLDNVKRLVVGLAELRVIAPKTRRPELYPRLGVEDIDVKDAQSRRVVLKDANGAVHAALILGSDRKNQSAADTTRGLYVRKVGEEQALLASGEIVATARPADWMDTTVVDIGSDRLYAVDISHPDGGRVRFSRKSRAIKDYELADIPPGQTVRSVALLTSMATALSGLRFDDVRAATVNALPDSGRTTAVYRAVDGLEIEVATATIEGAPWSAVRARYNPEAVLPDDTAVPPTAREPAAPAQDEPAEQSSATQVQAEVDAINARTGGWVYRLPDFKISMATKKFADLVKPADSPSATSQANPQATP